MWLEVLSGEDAGRVVELPPDRPFVLGRVQGADLVVRDPRASRLHAELTHQGDGLALADLDSANGTLVDGAPVERAVLHGGEEIRIGDVRIAVLARAPAVTGVPIPEPVRAPPPPAPSWSMVGRLVERRTRRGRRIAALSVAVAAAAVTAAVGLALSGALAEPTEEERVAAAVREVAPATVRVGAGIQAGTGWSLGGGLVVTAAHVVNGGAPFTVDGAPAAVTGVAPCEDLAVLRADAAPAAALELAAAGAWAQGQTVLAFGFPETAIPGEPPASTRGVVSAARTSFREPAADVPPYGRAIRTDTALDPGFSGGPLVDLDGRVIGVNAAARSTGRTGRPLQAANYAIAADRARAVLAELRAGRSLAWLGVSFAYPTVRQLADGRLPPGLWLRAAVPGTPAAAAGLGRGELLVAVDGRAIDATLSGWCRAAGGLRSGREVALDVVARDGGRRTVRVALA